MCSATVVCLFVLKAGWAEFADWTTLVTAGPNGSDAASVNTLWPESIDPDDTVPGPNSLDGIGETGLRLPQLAKCHCRIRRAAYRRK
jgi:hypothetical protein